MGLYLRFGMLLVVSLLGACSSMIPEEKPKVVSVQEGTASWYSRATNTPRGTGITASGITMYDDGATAAHRTLPFGTKVRFTNVATGQSEILTITDRGPYTRGRIIDVTKGVAQRTGFYGRGLTTGRVEVLH